ncbi:MAG: hypothetical protein CMI54_00220 [Parcubacteria group bacterium]|nr:hypothetical protein [Parcubacteria group bacterium]|tara:strand:- start:19898 stop:20779 length:882 start_codon:yes stop_codon:yes gene_type:complete
MNIDFTRQIKEIKEKEVLHKPFPTGEGYALYTKNEEGNFVKVLFSNGEQIKKYLNDLGYDWGNEKNEYTNFDCQHRLLKVLPELSKVDTIAADPQWEINEKEVEVKNEPLNPHPQAHRKMEDMPHLAVELREVDHPLHWDESNYDDKEAGIGFAEKEKKNDKKDKKDKNGKKNDDSKEEEKDKNGKKLPPWLNKKKSKSNYSALYHRVKGNVNMPWLYGFEEGDKVRNVNNQCKHFRSEGVVKEVKDLPDDAGFIVGYACSNAGKNWTEGDLLFKTPDQLEKMEGNVNMPWLY